VPIVGALEWFRHCPMNSANQFLEKREPTSAAAWRHDIR